MTNWWWGRSCNLDLHDCDEEKVADPKSIERYVKEVTKILKMKRVGPTRIRRFGHGKLRGYSFMQFIETSSITGHFDEKGDRAFIDIFSCKTYDTKKVATFTKKHFNAKSVRVRVEERF